MIEKNISFIGAGNMCRAIVNGVLMGEVACSDTLRIYDTDTSKYMDFKKIGVMGTSTMKEAVDFADIVFLAVKPQNFDDVLSELSSCDLFGKTLVTIAAGISTDYVAKGVGKEVGVIRVMPNTPMLIGMGAAAICKNAFTTEEDFDNVCKLFRVLGTVCTMGEDKLNSVIALHGSSPAFVYLFIKAMMDWAKAQGFDEKTAKELICSAFEGSAQMILQSDKSPDELIRAVSSPGGTTLAALAEFEKADVCRIISDACDACTKRAQELSR